MQEKNFFDKTTKEGRLHRSLLKMGILLAGMLVAGGYYLQMQKRGEQAFVFEEQVWQSEAELVSEEQKLESQVMNQAEGTFEAFTEAEIKTLLYVHVCGQVKNPGVYQLEEGARIYDAVQLAGGLTEEAFEEAVNLAELVKDGEQIRIPDRTETEYLLAKAKQENSGLINLNTATKEQLMALTGIGEARAKDIIAYRESNGGFETIEDVMKVPGIKEAAFAKIKDEIVVK